MPPRRRKSYDEVVAATAGLDNWKTWAGRTQGSDEFQYLDLFRAARRSFKHRFIWHAPTGTACPVCMTVNPEKDDWHITSCGHACCKNCLSLYAASLVRDPEHHGPLKCPVCPLPLRPRDAIEAIGDDQELIAIWDQKIRDQVLRALPAYRHCPYCARASNNALAGGGFVTPDCIAPINKQREKVAQNWLDHPMMSKAGLASFYFLYVYIYCGNHSSSIFVDILNTSVVPLWLLRRIWLIGRQLVAFEARRALFKPITVECPCCDEAFILNAESELGNTVMADEATKEWIGSNTRACPSCSVPISKIEGCNHIQCSYCRARFCWACMHVGSSCAAYGCKNGAPYGNADARGERGGGPDEETGILNRIIGIEREATHFDYRDLAVFAVIMFALLAREDPSVQFIVRVLITVFIFVFSSGTITLLLVLFLLFSLLRDTLNDIPWIDGHRNRRNAAAAPFRRNNNGDNNMARINELVEQRMISEAIHRSLSEQ